MLRHQAFKFRLYPNVEQRIWLARQFGCARFVYNHFLRQRIDDYAAHQGEQMQGLNYSDTARALVELKQQPETEWLGEVNSQALQQALRNLDTAYQNFFAGRAEFPKFRRKHDKQSFRVPQHFALDTASGHLCLPKLTPIKTPALAAGASVVLHWPVPGILKSVTVSRTPSGRYFASLLCEIELKERQPKRRGKEQGLDVGLKPLVVTSEGEKVETPAYLRQSEKQLAHLQRELSRKKLGSHHRNQARVKVARRHEHIANTCPTRSARGASAGQRADFLHQQSRRLIDESQAIYVEGLNVKGTALSSGVANHSLAKSISDANWGEFLRQLRYKGEWSGCRVEAIDRFFPSSRRCGHCGGIHAALTLADREWECAECHTRLDRDLNAARNILTAGCARAQQHQQEGRAGIAQTQTPGEMCASKARQRTRKPPALAVR